MGMGKQQKQQLGSAAVKLSEPDAADRHPLLSHLIDLVDGLTEGKQDWITLLHLDWSIDLSTFNLLSDGNQAIFQNKVIRRVGDVVSCIPQPYYQPMMMARQMHWLYTCCMQTMGLGRVRIVIAFNSASGSNPIIFATNRLDWSSSKVLRQWFKRRPAFDFSEFEQCQRLVVEAFAPN